MTKLCLGRPFEEGTKCMNTAMNPGYNWNDPKNKKCVEDVRAYDVAYENNDDAYLLKAEQEALGGKDGYDIGTKVNSPWGDNAVLHAQNIDGIDQVIKKITVKPGYMLSLQRHRGRAELWEVQSGTLTVIKDGERIEVSAGESVELPQGCVHCMNNVHDEPVTVIETQSGFCREADNVRLVDFNGRATVPLLTLTEMKSAKLYAEIHQEISKKFDCKTEPANQFSTPDFERKIEEMASKI